MGTRGGNFIVQNSDLLLVFGCRMNIRQISYNYKEFAKNAYKIVVDIDEAELHKPTVSVDMRIHADVADVMKDIADQAQAGLWYSPVMTAFFRAHTFSNRSFNSASSNSSHSWKPIFAYLSE